MAHNIMDADTAGCGTSNALPFLLSVGVNPGSVDFVSSSLVTIKNSNLSHESLTNGFVVELWSLVHLKSRGRQDPAEIPSDKISRRPSEGSSVK